MAHPAPTHTRRGAGALPRLFPLFVALACLALCGATSPATPPRVVSRPIPRATALTALSTFAEIYSGVAADYNSCQFKLSYLGEQEKNTTSLAGVSTVRVGGFERAPFLDFQYHGYYGNDSHFGDTLRISSSEIKAFMDQILARPALQDTLGPAEPKISLMVMRNYGVATMCWEHITTTAAEGDTLFRLLHDAVGSPADKATVDQFRHHMVGVRQ